MITEEFRFKTLHCTRAAIAELKEIFRTNDYIQSYDEHRDMIDFLINNSYLTRGRLNQILRQTSEFAGMYKAPVYHFSD